MGDYKLELISIHIPKTGGTSFRNTLQDVYGKDSVQLYYEKEKQIGHPILNKNTRVLHGHITSKEYLKLIKTHSFVNDVPMITWVRNPVERVVSNYFYLIEILSKQLEPFKNETPGLQKRMTKSLLEFADFKGHQNIISRYIKKEWIRTKKFIFIGDIDSYPQDLSRLSSLLKWSIINQYEHNKTKSKPTVDSNDIQFIKEVNEMDMKLYDEIINFNQDIHLANTE